MASLVEEIRILVEHLSPNYQQRVLEFAQTLDKMQQVPPPSPSAKLPPGTAGKDLLHFTLPLEDVVAMEQALEDCERVETDEQ